MMKKLFIFSLIISAFSCSKKEGSSGSVSEERVEITPFKINKILLRDTQSMKTAFVLADSGRMTVTEYHDNWDKDYKFLDNTSFNALRKCVWALVKNPGSRVYVNPLDKPSNSSQLKDRVVHCEMVELSTFDADGNEIITSQFLCDSTSTVRNINQIRFFESWYFNPKTNMIERELLGYSVHEYVGAKNAFRELFDVFVSDAAVEKARKYYFNKSAQ